jgi:phospholipid/cholesterol/gamma-HCH transport system ATP-binding protein
MSTLPVVKAKRWRTDHPDEPILELSGVSFTSDGKGVLDDISFKVNGGETRILLGRSGSGKSALLKLANGLLRPDSGIVRVFGRDLAALHQSEIFSLRQDIGMVFQDGALFDSLSVRDNVAYQLIENRVPAQEIDSRVMEVLRFVDLEETIDQFPPELSGGMQRRVAVARAIIGEPELLLYDSPTGGLDPVTSEKIIELVIKQRDVRGSSSLLVTQRLQDAFTCATHRFDQTLGKLIKLPDGQEDKNTTFLVLNEGKIIFDGSTLDLVHSQDRFIRSFLE